MRPEHLIAIGLTLAAVRVALALGRDLRAIRRRLKRAELDLTNVGRRLADLTDDQAAMRTVLRVRSDRPRAVRLPYTEGHDDHRLN